MSYFRAQTPAFLLQLLIVSRQIMYLVKLFIDRDHMWFIQTKVLILFSDTNTLSSTRNIGAHQINTGFIDSYYSIVI